MSLINFVPNNVVTTDTLDANGNVVSAVDSNGNAAIANSTGFNAFNNQYNGALQTALSYVQNISIVYS
jgi:hypothetical protein